MLDEGVLGTSRVLLHGDRALTCGYTHRDPAGHSIAEAIEQRLPGLDDSLTEGAEVVIERAVVKDEDWAEAWKAHFKPIRVGRHLVVKPTWELIEPAEEDIVIEIDPKMAFGAGSHPTTQLCLEVIEELAAPGMQVIDVGCGTGILAIAAAKLGATVTAIDIDRVAMRTCAENLALNGVQDRVVVKLENGLDATVEAADLIVANITAEAVVALAPNAAPLLLPGGSYVCSGFSLSSLPKVTAGLQQAGLIVQQRREKGEWLCLVTQRARVL